MDVLLRRGRATAAEVMNDLPGGQAYSTIRTQLRVLEEKGYVRHEDDGVRYVYCPLSIGNPPVSPRWSTSSTRSSKAQPDRRSRRCSAAKRRGSPTRNWTASPR